MKCTLLIFGAGVFTLRVGAGFKGGLDAAGTGRDDEGTPGEVWLLGCETRVGRGRREGLLQEGHTHGAPLAEEISLKPAHLRCAQD